MITKDQLQNVKQRTKEQQERHDSDLRNIIELLSCDRESSEPESMTSSLTGKQVRAAVDRELKDLHSQLAKAKSLTSFVNTNVNADVSNLEKLKNGLKSGYQLAPSIYAKTSTPLLDALTLENLDVPHESSPHAFLELVSSLSSSNLIVPPTSTFLKPNELSSGAKLTKSCPDLNNQNLKVTTATQTDSIECVSRSQSHISDTVSSTESLVESDGQVPYGQSHLPEGHFSVLGDDSETSSSFQTLPSITETSNSENSITSLVISDSVTPLEEYCSFETNPGFLLATPFSEEDNLEDAVDAQETKIMFHRHPPLRMTHSVIEEEEPTETLEDKDTNDNNNAGKQKLPVWQQSILSDSTSPEEKDSNKITEERQSKPSTSEDTDVNKDILSTSENSEDKRKLSASRMKLKAMHDQDKNKPVLTTMGTDGKLIDLVNGDLEEVELTEADKKFNEQLLEEARKVSQKFQNRKKRGQRSNSLTAPPREERSKTPSPTRLEPPVHIIQRAKSYESLDPDQDIEKGDLKPLNWVLPSSKQNDVNKNTQDEKETQDEEKETDDQIRKVSEESVKERRDSDDIDIKADILKALQPTEQTREIPIKSLSKINQPLSKLREENKLHKKRDSKFRMPELSEASETESAKEGESGESDTSLGEQTEIKAESESEAPQSPITPSLPDSMLDILGLKRKIEKSPGSLSDQEVESKFQALALAFKTDKFTLEKRLELQHRQRDLAEDNVYREVNQLKEALVALNPICVDVETKDVLDKLKHHVDIIQQTATRLSSKAEVHGAVQQEGRMNHAVEVMINHVENLRRLYEREHAELEDTKKLLTENRLLRTSTGDDLDSRLNKRSMSVAVGKDAKARFAQAVTTTALRNKVSGLFAGGRRASAAPDFRSLTDKQNSLPEEDKTYIPKSSSTPNTPTTPRPRLSLGAAASMVRSGQTSPTADKKVDTAVKEEEVFQKGFEQGARTQVSRDLDDLREQQKVFCDNLEELMDSADQELENEQEEEEEHKTWLWSREWDKTTKILRITVATLVFVAALFSLLFTILPLESCDRRNSIPVSWTSITELFWPYTSIRHQSPPPQ
ncbi:uncharacterized protein LOC144452794 [Glandiceps talaboti]